MTDLRFIRITNMTQFEAIPRKLFEKVSDFGDNLERLYQLAPAYLARPETMLYGILTDEPKAVVGVLWIEADLLDDTFHVPLLSAESVDDTLVLSEVMKFILALAKEMGAKGIEMATDRPKAFSRYGFEPTGQVLTRLDLERKDDEQAIGHEKSKGSVGLEPVKVPAVHIKRPKRRTA